MKDKRKADLENVIKEAASIANSIKVDIYIY